MVGGRQPLDNGARDRHAVVSARSTSDLIEESEAPRCGIAQDGCRLNHLHHECALPTGNVIAGTRAQKNTVHETYPGSLGGHE
jgi:hypothetical protein